LCLRTQRKRKKKRNLKVSRTPGSTKVIAVTPADVIAVIFIVGLMFLKFQGVNHTVDTILAVISAFYFGGRLGLWSKK